MMAKAEWNGKVIAESDVYEEVEGSIYFPPHSVKKEFLKESESHTTCPVKREASYYNVIVDGKVNKDAAWCYPRPKEAAKHIKGYIAFWNGVKVSK